MKSILILQVLFTILILSASISLASSSSVEPLKKSSAPLPSEDVFLTFVRRSAEAEGEGAGEKFYIVGDYAWKSTLTGLNILKHEESTQSAAMAMTFQYAADGRTWGIGADYKLKVGFKKTPFKLDPVAVNGSCNEFTISTLDGIPLVAYESDPPISFFLQTRYPSEPPALFRIIEEGEVGSHYQNLRANIIRTADSISKAHAHANATTFDTEAAYRELVESMARNGQLSGEEVFYVAHKIRTDLGVSSEAFRTLPEQATLLVGGNVNLKWFWGGRSDDLAVPMRYVTASYSNANAHTKLLPYNFHYEATNQSWTLTYAAEIHKLYIGGGPGYDLLERTVSDSDGPSRPSVYPYPLRIKLAENLDKFEVLVQVSRYTDTDPWFLCSQTRGNRTTFFAQSRCPDPTNFHVEGYLS